MNYVEIPPITKADALKAFLGNEPAEIAHALLCITWHIDDWQWVQDRCLHFLDSLVPNVRNTAIMCLGHLARIHGKLNKRDVIAELAKLQSDPEYAGRAEDAMDDIEMYIKDNA